MPWKISFGPQDILSINGAVITAERWTSLAFHSNFDDHQITVTKPSGKVFTIAPRKEPKNETHS